MQRLGVLVLLIAASLGPGAAVQAAGLINAIVNDPLTGVAIDGYDPVSYFTEPQPLQGRPDHVYEWGGVPWYFASAANRDVFMRRPDIYAPRYGGHCATSLSRGFVSDGKPMLYAISGARLYLFYSVANREAFLDADAPPVTAANTNWNRLQTNLTQGDQTIAAAIGTGE